MQCYKEHGRSPPLCNSLRPHASSAHPDRLNNCQRRLDAARRTVLVAAPWQPEGADGQEALFVAAKLQAGVEEQPRRGSMARMIWSITDTPFAPADPSTCLQEAAVVLAHALLHCLHAGLHRSQPCARGARPCPRRGLQKRWEAQEEHRAHPARQTQGRRKSQAGVFAAPLTRAADSPHFIQDQRCAGMLQMRMQC